MNKILFIISFTLLPLITCTTKQITNQKNIKSADTIPMLHQIYQGKINNKYKIIAYLQHDSNEIYGKYFYKNIGDELIIRGKFLKKDSVKLDEYNTSGKHTGTFLGKLTNNQIIGKWSNNNDTFYFELTKSVKTFGQLKPESVINKIKNDTFKNFIINFAETKLPIHYSDATYAAEYKAYIDTSFSTLFLDPNYEENTFDNYGIYAFTYGFCIPLKNFILIASPMTFEPGVAGIYRIDYQLNTLSYDGNIIDYETIGGFGTDNDYNTATNDEAEVFIDTNLTITVNIKYETINVEKNKTIDSSSKKIKYHLTKNGKIVTDTTINN